MPATIYIKPIYIYGKGAGLQQSGLTAEDTKITIDILAGVAKECHGIKTTVYYKLTSS